MKICAISDIHGNLYNGIPECDVLCICGDVIPLNIQRSMDASLKWWQVRFAEWAKKLPCKKIFVVPGNHDFYLESKLGEEWNDFIINYEVYTNNKVRFLVDELYEYNGIKFYGTPWIKPIEFQEGRWAFEYPSNDIEDKPFTKIPYCDILLTHDNPNYNSTLDHCSYAKYSYHLFGHWHDGIAYNFLNQYNCSILNDNYDLKKDLEIVTIDIMTQEEKQQVEQEFLKKLLADFRDKISATILETVGTTIDDCDQDFIEFLESYLVKEEVQSEDEIPWNNINVVTENELQQAIISSLLV